MQPLQTLRLEPALDLVVLGEGEETACELVYAAEGHGAGTPLALGHIAGLAWRDDQGMARESPRRQPLADLDSLPVPLRTNLVWPDDVQPGFYQAPITSRGCPYQCIYCAAPCLDQHRVRFHSVGRVVEEIAALRRDHAVDYLFFHDSVFTLNRRRTIDLCQEVIERGLVTPFSCQTRVDHLDLELLLQLRSAGCQHILLGIESGSEESLRRMRKQVTLDTVRQAVRQVKEAGIHSTGFFMIGFPWDLGSSTVAEGG